MHDDEDRDDDGDDGCVLQVWKRSLGTGDVKLRIQTCNVHAYLRGDGKADEVHTCCLDENVIPSEEEVAENGQFFYGKRGEPVYGNIHLSKISTGRQRWGMG